MLYLIINTMHGLMNSLHSLGMLHSAHGPMNQTGIDVSNIARGCHKTKYSLRFDHINMQQASHRPQVLLAALINARLVSMKIDKYGFMPECVHWCSDSYIYIYHGARWVVMGQTAQSAVFYIDQILTMGSIRIYIVDLRFILFI